MEEINTITTKPCRRVPDPPPSFFNIQPMNNWIEEAKTMEIPNKLYGELWYEGEMTILYASAGVGKTIYAFQIADSITYDLQMKVVYIDLELSSKQVEKRYSNNYENHYVFSNDFYRVEIDPDAEIPINAKFDEFLMAQIEATLLKVDAKILIVDNITYFRDDQEKAKDALKMMKQLKALKKKYSLSILILAHTPKRDKSKPITRNDISGSSMIVNFADAAFGIGESVQGTDIRYVKQTKPSRYSSTVYDASNVITYRITNDYNFTKFITTGYDNESDHLETKNSKDLDSRNDEIMDLRRKGLSFRDIGEKTDISHTQVKRIIYKNENQSKLQF